MKLSIAMMVKNEEKYLQECLEALQPLREAVDSELIIVDTGSEDRTVEIARQFTDKVYFHQWNNDFAAMRNKTIEYATGEWLLILDGDEILADARGAIRFLKSPDSKKYKTGIFKFRNTTRLDDESAYFTCYLPRLFKNDNFSYKGSIHEQPQFKNPIVEIPGEIIHYGYLSTDKELMEYKFRRNVGILKEELAKNSENSYYWFQLSQSYGMYQDYENALEAALKAYQTACRNNEDLADRMYIYDQLALCYLWNKRYEDVEATCREALKIKKGYLDIHYYLAEAQRAMSKDREAIKNYREYLRLYLDDSYQMDVTMSNKTAGKHEYVCLYLCMLHHKLREDEAALRYAKKISSEKVFCQAIPQIVEIYVDSGKFTRLRGFYQEKIEDSEDTVVDIFFTALENTLLKVKDDDRRARIIELFTAARDSYALLYRVKQLVLQDKNEMPKELYEAVKDIDYSKLPVFFADILYWFIKNKHELREITGRFRLPLIQSHFAYLAQTHKNFSEEAVAYLQASPQAADLDTAKVNKELAKTILLADKCNMEQYRYALERYLAEGTYYLARVYNPLLLENSRVSDFMCDEDAFLFNMITAAKNKEISKVEYVKKLRHALGIFPAMKRAIEILLADVQNEIDEENSEKNSQIAENAEFQLLKEQLKENIRALLDAGRVGEAKTIINQYLKLVPNDEEMATLQARIDAVQRQNANNSHLQDLFIGKDNPKYPKVTIIIPTYNQKEFLKEAIEGCLKQDYPNLEILVGDDCSTDGTHLMMKKYQEYPQIKYIRNSKNLGAGNNSQYLLENHATAKYGMILNHDDFLIKEDYIAKAVNLFRENPSLSLVWANCLINDENLGKQSSTNFRNPKIIKGIDYFKYYETEKYPHITGTLTSVFDMEKLKNTNFGQEKTKIRDTFLYLNLMLVGDVGFIDEHVAVYRVHKDSISNNLPKEFDLSTIQEFEIIKNKVLKQKIATGKEMELWINRRVFSFIFWRFKVLWSNNEKKYAIKLLTEISKDYPIIYEHVLDNI